MNVPVVGILVCDHIAGDDLIAAAEGRDYDGMYVDFLRRGNPDLDVRVYDAVGGELPDSPDECDAWIITGSKHDAYADESWIVNLRTFIGDLHQHRARTVGICFGHQAVAHALGGEAGPAGVWKAGPQDLKVEPNPWFDGADVRLNAMHRDVVHRLPHDAVDIGVGTTADHPAYLVGDNILCFQDHPEFDRRYTSALVSARRDRLGDELTDVALERSETEETHGDTVARWITDFLLDIRR